MKRCRPRAEDGLTPMIEAEGATTMMNTILTFNVKYDASSSQLQCLNYKQAQPIENKRAR